MDILYDIAKVILDELSIPDSTENLKVLSLISLFDETSIKDIFTSEDDHNERTLLEYIFLGLNKVYFLKKLRIFRARLDDMNLTMINVFKSKEMKYTGFSSYFITKEYDMFTLDKYYLKTHKFNIDYFNPVDVFSPWIVDTLLVYSKHYSFLLRCIYEQVSLSIEPIIDNLSIVIINNTIMHGNITGLLETSLSLPEKYINIQVYAKNKKKQLIYILWLKINKNNETANIECVLCQTIDMYNNNSISHNYLATFLRSISNRIDE